MDEFHTSGHRPADVLAPKDPVEHYTQTDHQITEHGTPDPAPTPSFMHGPALSRESGPSIVSTDDRPLPVVKVLSVRGVEYAMMSVALWFGAGSLIWILDSLIMGGATFDALAFPLSILLVTMPIFALLYLRLRKAELSDPSLRLEPSKRRYSQITQLLAFLTCIFNLITLVYMIMGMVSGEDAGSLGKTIGATAVNLAVAGGVLVYYWFDEHKLIKR